MSAEPKSAREVYIRVAVTAIDIIVDIRNIYIGEGICVTSWFLRLLGKDVQY